MTHNPNFAIYNPHNLPVDQLPVIYGFNNGGTYGFMGALLMAEDGTCLGGHVCSDESYMPYDLGVVNGYRPDRHATFKAHYPDGYRLDFVPYDQVKTHERLQKAFQLNKELAKLEESRDEL